MNAHVTWQRPLAFALILLFLLPVIAAADGEDDLSLEVSELQIPDKGYFVVGDIFSFSAAIHNNGESAAAVSTNPTCPIAFSIVADGIVLYDSFEEDGCREQSQGSEVGALQSLELGVVDYTIDELPISGEIDLLISAPSSGLAMTITLPVQKEILVPDNLEIEVIIAETASGDSLHDEVESLEALVRFINTGSQTIELPQDSACFLRVQIGDSIDQLTDIDCAGGYQSLGPHSLVDVGWLSFDGSMLDGEHNLKIGLPAQDDLDDVISFGYANTGMESISNLSAAIIVEDRSYSSGDSISLSASISNTGGEEVQVMFSSTCRAEIHIIDQVGRVVYDTRDFRECPEMNVSHEIGVDEVLVIQHSDWNFYDRDGCEIETGTYRMVVDVMEFDVRGYSDFDFVSNGASIECDDEMEMDVSIDSVTEKSEDSVGFEVTLLSLDVNDLRWSQPCRLTVSLYDESTGWPVSQFYQSCGEDSGSRIRLHSQQSIILEDLFLEMKDTDQVMLEDGRYRIEVSTNSWPSSSGELIIDWPLPAEEVIDDSSDEQIEEDSSEELQGTTAHGQWQYVTTEMGGCWLFTDDLGRESVLADSTAIGLQWQPETANAGNYSIVIAEEKHPSCSQYQTSFILLEIIDEYLIQSEISESVEQAPVKEQDSVIEEYGGTVLTSVAAVSITAMLIAFVTSHEGIRLPLTGIGLSLMGLIGRTHETNDGKFQRGRLMGYLTANPGCHFRALLAALQMSNGQLTHHIKVLEDEERIWRRPDGRLMRFYPSTISMATPEEDLPIPPLSPDPNSLQGKILKLLDGDGEMGTYPTQADLAVRLEKSQQLVSHHLRTLQKFGLVEKKKFGVRNRYKLTREALFLLESNDL